MVCKKNLWAKIWATLGPAHRPAGWSWANIGPASTIRTIRTYYRFEDRPHVDLGPFERSIDLRTGLIPISDHVADSWTNLDKDLGSFGRPICGPASRTVLGHSGYSSILRDKVWLFCRFDAVPRHLATPWFAVRALNTESKTLSPWRFRFVRPRHILCFGRHVPF